jgi:hypothetical protein
MMELVNARSISLESSPSARHEQTACAILRTPKPFSELS